MWWSRLPDPPAPVPPGADEEVEVDPRLHDDPALADPTTGLVLGPAAPRDQPAPQAKAAPKRPFRRRGKGNKQAPRALSPLEPVAEGLEASDGDSRSPSGSDDSEASASSVSSSATTARQDAIIAQNARVNARRAAKRAKLQNEQYERDRVEPRGRDPTPRPISPAPVSAPVIEQTNSDVLHALEESWHK